MTSAASYFHKTVLKKDLTRFAPVWILMTILLCIILPNSVRPDMDPEYLAQWLQDGSVVSMAVPNLLYGFLCAALLFGDLFVPKLCYALHAMPLKREGWFLTHLVSGVLFMLIPYGAASLVCTVRLGQFWHLGLLWLVYTGLSYLFFFGLGVFSAMLAGNRTGMVLIYGVINGFSILVYGFLSTVYLPLLPGLMLGSNLFVRFCPVMQLFQANFSENPFTIFWILGAAGLVLLVLSLLLYRKRNLETAGDFIAFSGVRPVFLLIYTFAVSLAFYMLCSIFLPAKAAGRWSLIPGLLLGYFTGQMLITRTLRVFSPRKITGCVILTVLFLTSTLVTRLDPLGLVEKQPDPEDVVSMSYSGDYNGLYNDEFYRQVLSSAQFIGAAPTDNPFWEQDSHYIPPAHTLTKPEDLAALRDLHTLILDGNPRAEGGQVPFYISYNLSDGSVLERRYLLPAKTPLVTLVHHFLSRPDFILGYGDWEAFAASVTEVRSSRWSDALLENVETFTRDPALIRQILEAVRADCEAGLICRPDEVVYQLEGFPEEDIYTNSFEYLTLRLSGHPGASYRILSVSEDLLEQYLAMMGADLP